MRGLLRPLIFWFFFQSQGDQDQRKLQRNLRKKK